MDITAQRKAFEQLCMMVHQDIQLLAKTPEDQAAYAISGLLQEEKPLAKAYIENLLDGSISTSMIEAVWKQSPAQIRMTDGEMLIKFLRLILKELG